MCSSIKSFFAPDVPDRTIPEVDPEQQRAEQRRRAQRARSRARGGYGLSSTQQTGPGGVTNPTAGKGAKTLLGM